MKFIVYFIACAIALWAFTFGGGWILAVAFLPTPYGLVACILIIAALIALPLKLAKRLG